MRRRFAAMLLFITLVFGTVTPVCADAAQEDPGVGMRGIEPEYTEGVSGSEQTEDESALEYLEEDSDFGNTENESVAEDPDMPEQGNAIEASDSAELVDESVVYAGTADESDKTDESDESERAADISSAVISDIAPVSYTGAPLTPDFTVTEAGESGRTLTEETDFAVSFADNTNVGTATLTITGIGAYSGTQEKSFQILPGQVMPEVALEKDVYVYDGTAKKPAVTVTVDPPAGLPADDGTGGDTPTNPWGDDAIELPAIPINGMAFTQALGSSLSEDLSEDSPEDAQTELQTAAEAELQTDAQTELQTAAEAELQTDTRTELQTDAESVSVDRELAGQGQDSSAPILLQEGDDYDVSYPEDCVQAGTYTVMVTLKGNYEGAGEARFTISPRSLPSEITLSTDSCSFNGKERKPSVTAAYNGRELVKNKDYTVKYENNINVGTAVVVVAGKGNFGGTVRKSFKIVPRKIKPEVALSKTSFTFNGKTQKPAVTVKDHGTKLASSNYTVAYTYGGKASDCKNAGTYKVSVSLKGNYSGSNTASYKIAAKKITPAVTLAKTVYTWNGKPQKPAVTVKDGSTKLASSNYTVTYTYGGKASGCKNVGTYKVTVKMKGNYSGTKTSAFRINPKGTSLTGLSAAPRAFTASWKKQTSQTTGYQIQYSTSSSFKSGNKTVTVKGAAASSKKIAKLAAGKTYYVRIRTYRTVGEKNYYSSWSVKKSVKTMK